MGRHNRGGLGGGGGFWEDDARVEEIMDSEEEEVDQYGRPISRNGRGYMRQLEYGGRGPRRRPNNFEDLPEEIESVDGGDYDLYDHGDSTVAYAVQLAMRDKEDQLVEVALERIRRAQMLGKKNVRLSQRELDALERKRQQTDDPSGARRVTQAGASMNIKPPSKRKSKKPKAYEQGMAPYPATPIEPGWGGGGFGPPLPPVSAPAQAPAPSGRPSSSSSRPPSSSSAHRPRTPTTQSLRPQQSNSPLRPGYPAFTERFPANNRPQSMPMPQHTAYSRPLPDDPSWAPPYYHPIPNPLQSPMQMNPYASEQPPYQPQLPSDLRVGPQSRMSYPAGMSPIQAQYRQSPDNTRRGWQEQEPESESEDSSDEDEEGEDTESSDEEEDDDDEVQPVPVQPVQPVQPAPVLADRPAPPGLQRRKVSGSRQRRSR